MVAARGGGARSAPSAAGGQGVTQHVPGSVKHEHIAACIRRILYYNDRGAYWVQTAETVLDILDVQHIRDSPIGDAETRGISGASPAYARYPRGYSAPVPGFLRVCALYRRTQHILRASPVSAASRSLDALHARLVATPKESGCTFGIHYF